MDNRNEVIDGYRGIAILSVLLFHYLVRWAPPFSPVNLYGYHVAFPSWLALGRFGVEIFFVISGLVIAMTLDRCSSAFEFGVRRFARLYPAYLACSILTFALMRLIGPKEFQSSVSDFFANLTMLAHNLHRREVDGAYWSLAVEVKFYAIAAAAYWFAKHDFWKVIAGVGIAGALLAFIWPAIANEGLDAQYMPLFLAGIAAWLMLLAGRRLEGVIAAVLAAALYALNAWQFRDPITSPWMIHGFILIISGSMLTLLAFAPRLKLPGLEFVGRISYSYYLLHQFIGVTLIAIAVRSGVPALVAALLVAAFMGALAWLSYMFVERPGGKVITNAYRALSMPRLQLLASPHVSGSAPD